MKVIKILNKSLGTVITAKLPLNVKDKVIPPTANTSTIEDLILEATQAKPSNISNVYIVVVNEVIGVDTTGLNFNTSSYTELYALINEISNRAKA
jgi:hypothetical protein